MGPTSVEDTDHLAPTTLVARILTNLDQHSGDDTHFCGPARGKDTDHSEPTNGEICVADSDMSDQSSTHEFDHALHLTKICILNNHCSSANREGLWFM